MADAVNSCGYKTESPYFVKVTELLASNLDKWHSFPGDSRNMHPDHSVPKNQSTQVSTVTALRAGESAVQIPVEASNFTLLRKVHMVSEIHRFSFPGLKRPVLVDNHTPAPSVQVQNDSLVYITAWAGKSLTCT